MNKRQIYAFAMNLWELSNFKSGKICEMFRISGDLPPPHPPLPNEIGNTA